MAIIKNAVPFGNGFNIGSAGPIDSRMRVPYLSDLTSVWGTDAPAYAGMVVIVNEEDKAYILKTSGFNELTGAPIAADPTVLDNWKPVGSNETLSAESYAAAKALATDDLLGSLIYVSADSDEGTKGFYIVVGDKDIQRLGTVSATGDLSGDVANLKSAVGDAESGLIKDVADLQDAVGAIEIPVTDVQVGGVSVLEGGVAKIVIPDVDFTEVNNAIAGKVDKNGTDRLMTEAEGAKLAGIAENAQVNKLEVVKVNGTPLSIDDQDKSVNVVIPECAVKGVVTNKENQQILTLNPDGLIDTTLSITYVHDDDNETPYQIQLLGVGNKVISSIDASVFVKDGMLSDASLVKNPEGKDEGTYLHLVFNTDAGKNDIYVAVSDLIDTYVGSDTIAVDGKVISAKIDVNAEEKYLTSGVNGLYVSGVDAAILAAKNAVVGSEDSATKDDVTLHGVKKYASDLVATHTSAVTTALTGKVDTTTYESFVSTTNSAIDALKVKDVDVTEIAGIKLTKSETGTVGVSVDSEKLGTALVGATGEVGSVSGTTVKLGKDIVIEEVIKDAEGNESTQQVVIGQAGSSIQSTIETLAGKIEAAIAGGITAIDGGEYITVGGSATSKTLAVNMVKIGKYLVDDSSAIKVDSESGKLTLEWEDIQ